MDFQNVKDIYRIIIHCAATKPSQDIGVQTIRYWHMERGFSDIGYHFVIRRNGELQNGRPVSFVGAHTQGYNTNSIGICMIGGVSEDDVNIPENNFTSAQWETLENLVKDLKWNKDFNIQEIRGHNEFANKACPSFDVQNWKKSVGL